MTAHVEAVWHQGRTGLAVDVGQRREPVPEPVEELLTGPGAELSGDATHDLLRAERRLRQAIAELGAHTPQVTTHRTALPARRRPRRRALWHWRRDERPDQAGPAATGEFPQAQRTEQDALSLLDTLRSYVISLDPPAGPLRDAAEGWRRGPHPPASVVVFDSEPVFLEADPRRATTGGCGGTTIAGTEQFGHGWRRDGDDEDPGATADDNPIQPGPWHIGHIGRTTEVYAIRRCAYLPPQVWLLGTGFDTVAVVRHALTPIMSRIAEPNSLILAATTVHATQPA